MHLEFKGVVYVKNSFGNNVILTLFGESHGEAIGAVLDGVAPGIVLDEEYIKSQMNKRSAFGDFSTKRHEPDAVRIISGVYDGRTTGTPICLIIGNNDQKSSDYDAIRYVMRPGHADYTGFVKYHGFNDYRGGGHFSGRLTAPIVAAGAIALLALKSKNIAIATHIKRCAGISDREFSNDLSKDAEYLNGLDFAVLDSSQGKLMIEAIKAAADDGDSVGGVLETVILGVPAGIGEPWFDSVEGMLSHALFSIPALKGVEFGCGFDFADMRASCSNDTMYFSESGAVKTATNNNGGVNGGITNGMPIIFRSVIKPTPSIAQKQNTVDIATGENTELKIVGRHDPTIVHRARVVVDSIAALTVCDMLVSRFGTEYFAPKSNE